MKVIHHLFGKGFGVVVFVFKQIFKRVDVEKRRYRDVAIVFAEVAPLHKLCVQASDIARRGIVTL